MAHAVRKAAHALAEEGELLNVHSELKDLSHAVDNRIRIHERAVKTLVKWTQRKKEDESIQAFVLRISELEEESCNVDRKYNEEFRVFVRSWKEVIAEKKELNAKVAAYKKAQKNVEQARKKFTQTEAKQPRDEEKIHKARKQLESIEAGCEEVKTAMEDKLLEVQQEKHGRLRSGYLTLYHAQMTRLRELVAVQERFLQAVNEFPAVKSRKEDGTFEFGEWEDKPEESPIWYKGEEFLAKLKTIRDEHLAEMEKLRRKHTDDLEGLLRKRDEDDAQKIESYSAEMMTMYNENKALMERVKLDHKRALEAAEEKLSRTDKELNEKITQLEDKIARQNAELTATRKELKAQATEANRLEDTIEGLKMAAVERATDQATLSVATTEPIFKQDANAYFFDCIHRARQELDDFKLAAKKGEDHFDYDNLSSRFADTLTHSLLATWTLSKCSRAENSSDLVPLAQDFCVAGKEVFQIVKSGLGDAQHARPILGSSSPQAAPKSKSSKNMVKAMYDHASREHQGTVLIGFRKGDVMEMVKSRDDGWCKVVKGSESGWAPSSYLKPVEAPDAPDGGESAPKAPDTPELGASPVLQRRSTVPAAPAVDKTAEQLEEAFLQAHTALLSKGKEIVARDRELALLSNALADNLGSKVSAAQQSVLDALAHVEKMQTETRNTDSGRRLEVNENILGLTFKLEKHMQSLIEAANAMRAGLEETKGTQSDDEFNAKHEKWFEGLSQAVDSMVEGNPILTEALRSVVRKKGKHEELQVSARNISAAVAQLAALSRTKTLRDGDTSLSRLNHLTEEVKNVVHELLAGVRECHELDLASVMLEDYGNLSETEAKRLVMATQVNVLKMESQLEREHEKLRRLRRLVNYTDEQ